MFFNAISEWAAAINPTKPKISRRGFLCFVPVVYCLFSLIIHHRFCGNQTWIKTSFRKNNYPTDFLPPPFHPFFQCHLCSFTKDTHHPPRKQPPVSAMVIIKAVATTKAAKRQYLPTKKKIHPVTPGWKRLTTHQQKLAIHLGGRSKLGGGKWQISI